MYTTTIATTNNTDSPLSGDILVGFGIKLPFRYLVPRGSKFSIKELKSEIFVLNDLDFFDESSIPFDARRIDALEKIKELSLSKVMVILECPSIEPEEASKIYRCNSSNEWESTAIFHRSSNMRAVLESVNRLTFALFQEAKLFYGVNQLDLITATGLLLDHMYVASIFVGRDSVNFKEIEEMFEFRNKRSVKSFGGQLSQINGQLTKPVIAGINRRLNATHYPFIEYSFSARTLWRNDPETSLVFSVMALENFVYILAKQRVLKDANIPSDEKADIIEDFGKAGGFTALFRILMFTVLTPSERPDQPLIDQCFQAITLRNNMIHSKLTKDGKLKHRENGQHYQLSKSCLDLVDKLRNLIS